MQAKRLISHGSGTMCVMSRKQENARARMPLAAALAAVEAMLTEAASDLVRSWRKGRHTLAELLTDPDEAAHVAGSTGFGLDAPIDLADNDTLFLVLEAKLLWENKGWTLPRHVIRMAAANGIRRENQRLRGHEVAE
jgi:hypothetical protein